MKCRYCKQPVTLLLDLGRIPLVNYFPTKQESKRIKKYPLHMWFCPSCGLGQTGETIAPNDIFSEYHYQTGASAPLVRHLKTLAKLIQRHTPKAVLDIGCNDGTLLKYLNNKGTHVLGVDPAKNIATTPGITVLHNFFSSSLAKRIRRKHGKFSFITITHTLANIPDIHDFLEGVRLLLAPQGKVYIEVASCKDMVSTGSVDSMYHEHYWYFTRYGLERVLMDAGFIVDRMLHGASQGGAIRVYASAGTKRMSLRKRIKPHAFPDTIKRHILETLGTFRGKKIVGFGAPAKAVTLINWLQLTQKDIMFVVDATKVKQGRIVPGTDIPVYPESSLTESKVDVVVLFAWNYRREILRKLSRLVPRGTPVVIPFPSCIVVKSP